MPFLFFSFSFFSFKNSTYSRIPPSYLNTSSFSFLLFKSLNVILIPLFKKANSLILLIIVFALNFIDEKISFEGRKVISVPVSLDFPIVLRAAFAVPLINSIKYFFPSLLI